MAKYWLTGAVALAMMNGAALAQSAPPATPPSTRSVPADASGPLPTPVSQDTNGDNRSEFEKGQDYTRAANRVQAEQDRNSERRSARTTETTTSAPAPVRIYRQERIDTTGGDGSTTSQVTTTPGR
jgi:hypothetical protein